LVEITTITGYW